MKISIQNFGGVAPAINSRYLADNRAQVATNIQAFASGGSMRPLNSLLPTAESVPLTANTIYRYGQSTTSATEQWLYWSGDVDVVRGQIAGDTEEWTHYSGDGIPKSIHASALGAPISLGLPPPDTAPIVRVFGDPPTDNSNESAVTMVFVVTYLRAIAGLTAESTISPASNSVDVFLSTQYPLITLPDLPLASNITGFRIYCSIEGTYLYCAEWAASYAGLEVAMIKHPEDFGEECPSLFWAPPPDDLQGLVNLPGGVVAGFVGRDVYLCEPYRPYAWPDSYRLSLDYPVVGLGVIDTTLVALTTGEPYFIQGGHPDSMVVVKAGIPQACVSKRSIVSINGAVYYASPDGLMMLSPGGSGLVTQAQYRRKDWQALNPETFHAYGHDLKYIAFRQEDGGARVGWTLDIASGEVRENSIAVRAGFSDLQLDTLYVVTDDDSAVKKWDLGTALTATWKSKKFTLPRPTFFSYAQLLAESYPATMRVYADGALFRSITFASRDPKRLPPGEKVAWEMELESSSEVYAMTIAQSIEEIAG